MSDTRTPFLLQATQVALYVGMAVAIAFAPTDRIAVLLAGALSAAAWAQVILGAAVLRRRLPGFRIAPVLGRLGWYLAAAVPAAAAGVGVLWSLGGIGDGAFPVQGWWQALATCAIVAVAMLAVYFAALWATRNPEFRAFVASTLRRGTGARAEAE